MFKVGDIINDMFVDKDTDYLILQLEIKHITTYLIYYTVELVNLKEYELNDYKSFIITDYLYRYKLNINLTRKHKLKKLIKNEKNIHP